MSSFMVRIIKNGNENWFSFLSGIVSNIPITLMLAFDRNEHSRYYWLFFLLTIVISSAIVFFLIRVTILFINIKEIAREKYEQYVEEKKTLVPRQETEYLIEACNSKQKEVAILFTLSVVGIVLLLTLIILLWFV